MVKSNTKNLKRKEKKKNEIENIMKKAQQRIVNQRLIWFEIKCKI